MKRRNYLAIVFALVFLSIPFAGCSSSSTPSLKITGSLPSSGSVTSAYSGTLTGSGGTAPYTWSASGLPPGIVLGGANTSTATFSGTPTTPGTYGAAVTLTDAKSRTATYNVSIVISGGAAFTITPTGLGALTNGMLVTPVTVSFTPATTGPYTWAITQGALPAGLVLNNGTTTSATTVNSTGTSITITGTPTATGPYSFSLSVTDSATPQGSGLQAYSGTVSGSASATVCQPNPVLRGNEQALSLPFAFVAQGADSNDAPIAWAGSFTPNGSGGITAAAVDFIGDTLGPQTPRVTVASSTYTYGTDGRGCLYLVFGAAPAATANRVPSTATSGIHALNHGASREVAKPKAAVTATLPASLTLSFSVSQGYATGRIEEFDYANSAYVAAGYMYQQTASDFAVTSLASSFAFGLNGWYFFDAFGDLDRAAIAGNFTNASGTLSGTADLNVGGTPSGELTGGSGTLNATVDSTTGRGTGSYSIVQSGQPAVTFTFSFYIVNNGDLIIISSNPLSVGTDTSFMLTGRALQSSTTTGVFNGYYLSALSGIDINAGTNGGNYVSIGTVQATSGGSGGTIPAGTFYSNDAGALKTNAYTNATFATTTVSGGQRASFTGLGNHPPVAYLTSSTPDDGIVAFLVDTDVFASSGFVILQGTAAPSFSATSVQGSYAQGSSEDVTGVNGSEVGAYTFPGNSTYTGTIDGVGVNSNSQPGLAVNGTITINSDGSGNFDSSGKLLVTNGPLILAIDNKSGYLQPLLYVFINQTAAQ